jgi:hypothetical protein
MVLGAPLAAAPKVEPAGVITLVSGKVTLFSGADAAAKAADGKDLNLGQTVYAGDRLRTGANGRVALVLTDGTQLKVNYSSDITLKNKDSKGRGSARGIASIKVLIGDLWAKVTKKDSELEFDTPAAVAAVKGTEPLISVGPDGTLCLKLRSGKMALSNELDGSATLKADEQVCIAVHQPITQDLIQPWKPEAGAGSWDKTVTQASHATVTITYKDDGGNAKTLVVNYGAADPISGTAQTPAPAPGK